MQILSVLKVIPLKFWIIGAVVIFLGLSAYQTFIGDRKVGSVETVSPQPMASYESPSPAASQMATSSPTASAKASVKPSASVKASGSPVPSPSAAASATNNASPIPSITLSELSPSSGNFMQTFILKGNNFGNGGSVAFINPQGQVSAGAVVDTWSNTEIKAKVPAVRGGTDFQIEVSSGGKTSNRMTFRVNNGQPQLNSVSPNPAPGVSLTFSGSEYGSSNGVVSFYDGSSMIGTCAVSSWSESQIVCTAPSNLTSGREYGVQITTSDGRQTSFKFYTI